jgi:putative sigma-54 modulation protein
MSSFRVDVRAWNISVSDALREHVERRLEFALRRFAHWVELVTVRLVDINGPKGGRDKRCRLVVQLSTARIVLVEATDSDVYAAVSRAAMRADETVARIVTRRRPRPLAVRRGGARHARKRSVPWIPPFLAS